MKRGKMKNCKALTRILTATSRWREITQQQTTGALRLLLRGGRSRRQEERELQRDWEVTPAAPNWEASASLSGTSVKAGTLKTSARAQRRGSVVGQVWWHRPTWMQTHTSKYATIIKASSRWEVSSTWAPSRSHTNILLISGLEGLCAALSYLSYENVPLWVWGCINVWHTTDIKKKKNQYVTFESCLSAVIGLISTWMVHEVTQTQWMVKYLFLNIISMHGLFECDTAAFKCIMLGGEKYWLNMLLLFSPVSAVGAWSVLCAGHHNNRVRACDVHGCGAFNSNRWFLQIWFLCSNLKMTYAAARELPSGDELIMQHFWCCIPSLTVHCVAADMSCRVGSTCLWGRHDNIFIPQRKWITCSNITDHLRWCNFKVQLISTTKSMMMKFIDDSSGWRAGQTLVKYDKLEQAFKEGCVTPIFSIAPLAEVMIYIKQWTWCVMTMVLSTLHSPALWRVQWVGKTPLGISMMGWNFWMMVRRTRYQCSAWKWVQQGK